MQDTTTGKLQQVTLPRKHNNPKIAICLGPDEEFKNNCIKEEQTRKKNLNHSKTLELNGTVNETKCD